MYNRARAISELRFSEELSRLDLKAAMQLFVIPAVATVAAMLGYQNIARSINSLRVIIHFLYTQSALV